MTGNPTLNADTFKNVEDVDPRGFMTIEGTVNRTAFLLLLAALSATFTWSSYLDDKTTNMWPWVMAGAVGGFVVAIVTSFNRTWSPVTAPLYAILEGLCLGGLSSMLDAQRPGIAIQAVMLTFGTLAALLAAYHMGLITAGEKFKSGVIAATGGIAILYMVDIILGFFHIQIPFIFGNGPIGIGFSIFVVILAAMNLVIDFDFIDQGARSGAPKYMEWYASFGLLVTLVWLYLEIIRLLAKLRGRD